MWKEGRYLGYNMPLNGAFYTLSGGMVQDELANGS